MMEEELKIKTEIIKKQERLIQGWREELKDQLDKHNVVFEQLEANFSWCIMLLALLMAFFKRSCCLCSL